MIEVTTIDNVNGTNTNALWKMNKEGQTAVIMSASDYVKFMQDATYDPKFETIPLTGIKVIGQKNERSNKMETFNHPFEKISSPTHYFKCRS